MMPTPASSVVLHRDVDADDGAIQLVMETIEPSDFSNSVISWVNFESSVDVSADTALLTQPDLVVKCSGEVIWDSRA